MGTSLIFGGRFAESLPALQEGLAIYDDLGLPSLGLGSQLLGFGLIHLGRYEEAALHLQATLIRYRKTSDRHGVGMVLLNLGRIALAKESDEGAQAQLQESLTIFRNDGQLFGLSQALGTLGYVALRLGDPQAQSYLRENLEIAIEWKMFLPQLTALTGLALLLAEQGETERAVELYAVSLQHGHVANSRWYEDVVGRPIMAVAETLPPEVISAAKARGRARDPEETLTELRAEFKTRS